MEQGVGRQSEHTYERGDPWLISGQPENAMDQDPVRAGFGLIHW